MEIYPLKNVSGQSGIIRLLALNGITRYCGTAQSRLRGEATYSSTNEAIKFTKMKTTFKL